MLSLSANQKPVSKLCHQTQPIRGQYPRHVINLSQSEASILTELTQKTGTTALVRLLLAAVMQSSLVLTRSGTLEKLIIIIIIIIIH